MLAYEIMPVKNLLTYFFKFYSKYNYNYLKCTYGYGSQVTCTPLAAT